MRGACTPSGAGSDGGTGGNAAADRGEVALLVVFADQGGIGGVDCVFSPAPCNSVSFASSAQNSKCRGTNTIAFPERFGSTHMA